MWPMSSNCTSADRAPAGLGFANAVEPNPHPTRRLLRRGCVHWELDLTIGSMPLCQLDDQ
jgi:hypothetical protein